MNIEYFTMLNPVTVNHVDKDHVDKVILLTRFVFAYCRCFIARDVSTGVGVGGPFRATVLVIMTLTGKSRESHCSQ